MSPELARFVISYSYDEAALNLKKIIILIYYLAQLLQK